MIDVDAGGSRTSMSDKNNILMKKWRRVVVVLCDVHDCKDEDDLCVRITLLIRYGCC